MVDNAEYRKTGLSEAMVRKYFNDVNPRTIMTELQENEDTRDCSVPSILGTNTRISADIVVAWHNLGNT